MSKFLSGRLKQILIGIAGYTENKTVLQTTGKVGIGTTDAQQHSLFVVGSTNITDGINIGGDVDIDGQTELDNLNVSGVSTFTGFLEANGFVGIGTTNEQLHALVVVGSADISQGVNVGGGFTAVGVGSFQDDLYANKNLYVTSNIDVDGQTELDNLNVSGVSTFAGFVEANGRVGIGTTNAQQHALFVVGSTNITNGVNVGGGFTAVGIGSFQDDLYANKNLYVTSNIDVDGQTDLDNLTVTGLSTFTNNSYFNGNVNFTYNIDVDGNTELDNLNVSGVSTFTNNVDFNADIDVDGHTELDNLNVSGVSTFTGTSTFSGQIDANGGLTANQATVEDLTNDQIVVAGTGGRLESSENLTFDGSILNVIGHSEFDNINVSGVATFATLDVQTKFDVYDTQAVFHNDLHVAGNLSIGGTTTTLNAQDLQIFDKDIILGVTTDAFGNDISTDTTANHGGIAIASTEGSPLVPFFLAGVNEDIPDTYKQIMWVKHDSYGFGTTDAWLFNYAVGIGTTLVPNGVRLAVNDIHFTDNTLSIPNINISENLNVSGITTLAASGGITTTGGDLYVNGNLYADDLVLQNSSFSGGINVSGVSTFTNNVDFNADIDVDGHTELDNLNVSGVSTFSSTINVGNDITIDPTSGIITATAFIGGIYIDESEDDNVAYNVIFADTIGGGDPPNAYKKLQIDDGGITFNPSLNRLATGNISINYALVSDYVYHGGNFDAKYGFPSDNTFALFTSNVERFSVDSSGNVGINSNTPTTTLDVDGTLNITGTSTFGDTINGTNAIFTGIVTASNFIGNASSATIAGYATTAGISTNLKGGAGGSVPYQSSTDTTAFLANGSPGQVFQSNGGTNPPSWVDAAPANAITGLTIRDEGIIVGGANSVSQLNFTGLNITATSSGNISTITSSDNIVGTSLSITGITTFTNGPVQVGTGITLYAQTGIISAVAFYGSGQNLSDLITGIDVSKIEGIEIQDEGVGIGTEFKTLNFVGNNVKATTGVGNTVIITVGDYVNLAGVSTSVIGGIGSITQLQVTGISTFNNGPVFIGSTTSTGTSTQALQVTSGVYVSGNLGIGTTNPSSKIHVVGDILVNDTTSQGSVEKSLSTTTNTSIHSVSASIYRSVEYTIQATQGSNYHSTKILALHDGTTAYHSEYGTIFNNALVSTFDVNLAGGSIHLMASGASSSNTEYKVYFSATKI